MLAVVFTVAGVVTVFAQGLGGREGLRQPGALAVVTAVLTCAPVALRRRAPLPALLVSTAAIAVHILAHWPEGSLPLAVLFLTYSVGAWCRLRTAIVGLVAAETAVVVLGATGSMGLDSVDVFGIVAQFAAAWAVGVAVRNRRAATDARVREASERAEAERQSTARRVAEERLRIARELHDIVAHSMSVIAVQAGVGAHVLDERPDQATRRARRDLGHVAGTLAELRRLLGVLRDTDGATSRRAAPRASTTSPVWSADVRAAGLPVTLLVEGDAPARQPGLELSAYRIVQEALTNVIKHAGSPSRVDVIVAPPVRRDRPRGRRRRRRARPGAVQRRRPRCGRHARAGRPLGRRALRRSASRAAATASPRCCRAGATDDDPRRRRRRPGAGAQRLHDAAVGRRPTSRSSPRPATGSRP